MSLRDLTPQLRCADLRSTSQTTVRLPRASRCTTRPASPCGPGNALRPAATPRRPALPAHDRQPLPGPGQDHLRYWPTTAPGTPSPRALPGLLPARRTAPEELDGAVASRGKQR